MVAEQKPEEEQVEGEQADEVDEVDLPEGSPEEGAEDGLPIASPGEEDEQPDTLQDSMAGSLRLKRLMTEEESGGGPAAKKQRISNYGIGEQTMVDGLLKKWELEGDVVAQYVLDQLTMDDLKEISTSGWVPDKWRADKTPAELIARHAPEMREKKMVGGTAVDCISTFRFRTKISMVKDKVLRALSHKDLRYVMTNWDGKKSLDDLVEEAASSESKDDNTTIDCMPADPGLSTMARFHRLEFLDPVADCAVFGDANLTFSKKLAVHRSALGHVGRVIATTFEEIGTLRERYPEIDGIIKELESNLAEVYHGVDCTRIGMNAKFKGLENSLGAVYYNFPHSGAIQGFFDSHPAANWRHENLMRLFFRALRSFVKPGGTVKVSSNAGAVGVRFSYIIGSAIENEFCHTETVPFTEWVLHRYGRSYGDRRDSYKRPDASNNESYNAQAAGRDMVYCFEYQPSGKTLPPQLIRLPPNMRVLTSIPDGPFKNLHGAGKEKHAKALHQRFLSEISGVHVG